MLTKSDLKEINTLLTRQLKPIKTDVSKTRKDVDVMLSMFDREYVELRRRVDRIEEHLNLEPIAP